MGAPIARHIGAAPELLQSARVETGKHFFAREGIQPSQLPLRDGENRRAHFTVVRVGPVINEPDPLVFGRRGGISVAFGQTICWLLPVSTFAPITTRS